MPYGFTPPSQVFRRVGFDLSGGGGGTAVNMAIRPEELSRVCPSRVAVQQTLGGAWADIFGEGVVTIRIAGTTGWRGSSPLAGTGVSGEQAFRDLYAGTFSEYHARRDAILQGGGDPSVVELVFVDELDGFTDLVVPKVFTLKRSKTSPLMIRYNIEMLVIEPLGGSTGDGGDPITQAMTNPLGFLASADGFNAAADAIDAVFG